MSKPYLTAPRLRELDAQLSARDRAVLHRVGQLRFVSGGQLGRLQFAGVPQRTAREALLRLTSLDVLERLPRPVGGVRAGSAGYVYRLGVAGHHLAVLHGWQPAGRNRQTHVPGSLFVGHTLQIAELHTLLVEADRDRRIELIELVSELASQRRYSDPVGRQHILKPDSYVRLGIGEYEDSYFIEVDMGTEGSRALDSKLRQYVEYEASGQEQAERGVFPKVLWLTPGNQRAEAIAACIDCLPPVTHELFSVTSFTEWEVTGGVK